MVQLYGNVEVYKQIDDVIQLIGLRLTADGMKLYSS